MYPVDTLYDVKKDAGLRIRIERSLRERFVETCQAQDRSAAQVIREFMRNYVAQCGGPGHGSGSPLLGSLGEEKPMVESLHSDKMDE